MSFLKNFKGFPTKDMSKTNHIDIVQIVSDISRIDGEIEELESDVQSKVTKVSYSIGPSQTKDIPFVQDGLSHYYLIEGFGLSTSPCMFCVKQQMSTGYAELIGTMPSQLQITRLAQVLRLSNSSGSIPFRLIEIKF